GRQADGSISVTRRSARTGWFVIQDEESGVGRPPPLAASRSTKGSRREGPVRRPAGGLVAERPGRGIARMQIGTSSGMRGRVALIGLLLATAILHRSSISRQAGRGIRFGVTGFQRL